MANYISKLGLIGAAALLSFNLAAQEKPRAGTYEKDGINCRVSYNKEGKMGVLCISDKDGNTMQGDGSKLVFYNDKMLVKGMSGGSFIDEDSKLGRELTEKYRSTLKKVVSSGKQIRETPQVESDRPAYGHRKPLE